MAQPDQPSVFMLGFDALSQALIARGEDPDGALLRLVGSLRESGELLEQHCTQQNHHIAELTAGMYKIERGVNELAAHMHMDAPSSL